MSISSPILLSLTVACPRAPTSPCCSMGYAAPSAETLSAYHSVRRPRRAEGERPDLQWFLVCSRQPGGGGKNSRRQNPVLSLSLSLLIPCFLAQPSAALLELLSLSSLQFPPL